MSDLGVRDRWMAFRKSALSDALFDALRQADVEESTAESVRAAIVNTAGVPRRKPSAHPSPSASRRIHRSKIEALVRSVLPHLTEEQLRALELPVGLVLDHFRGGNK